MKIYDFFDKYWRGSWVICVLATIICFAVAVTQFVHYVREKNMNRGIIRWSYEVIQLFPIIVMLCIAIVFLVNSFRVGRIFFPVLTGEEKMVVGELTQIEIVSNDYRDEQAYDIMFEVNGIKFQETINTYSESEMIAILKNEGNKVKVTYTEQDDSFVVYTIWECSEMSRFGV